MWYVVISSSFSIIALMGDIELKARSWLELQGFAFGFFVCALHIFLLGRSAQRGQMLCMNFFKSCFLMNSHHIAYVLIVCVLGGLWVVPWSMQFCDGRREVCQTRLKDLAAKWMILNCDTQRKRWKSALFLFFFDQHHHSNWWAVTVMAKYIPFGLGQVGTQKNSLPLVIRRHIQATRKGFLLHKLYAPP